MNGVLRSETLAKRMREGVAVLLGSAFGFVFILISVYVLNEVLPGRTSSERQPSQVMSVLEPRSIQAEEVIEEAPKVQPSEESEPPPPLDLFEAKSGPGSSFDFAVFDSRGKDSLRKRALSELSETSDVSRLDEVPRRTSESTIEFPGDARKRGVEGFVTINLLISRQGRVLKSHLVDSHPQGVFDAAVLEASRKWAFSPPTQKGEPVQVWLRQTVRFDLQEKR